MIRQMPSSPTSGPTPHPPAAVSRSAPPRVLISADDLQRRVAELAAAVNRDYAESERLICVGVLKGSVFFLVDLVKRLELPVAIDFFQTSSYGGGTSPGEVRIRKDLD